MSDISGIIWIGAGVVFISTPRALTGFWSLFSKEPPVPYLIAQAKKKGINLKIPKFSLHWITIPAALVCGVVACHSVVQNKKQAANAPATNVVFQPVVTNQFGRSNTLATGRDSTAVGEGSVASGERATAVALNRITNTAAIGKDAEAGPGSIAIGAGAKAGVVPPSSSVSQSVGNNNVGTIVQLANVSNSPVTIGPRQKTLSEESLERIKMMLPPTYKTQRIEIYHSMGDNEGSRLNDQLSGLFKSAGFKVDSFTSMGGRVFRGIGIFVPVDFDDPVFEPAFLQLMSETKTSPSRENTGRTTNATSGTIKIIIGSD